MLTSPYQQRYPYMIDPSGQVVAPAIQGNRKSLLMELSGMPEDDLGQNHIWTSPPSPQPSLEEDQRSGKGAGLLGLLMGMF